MSVLLLMQKDFHCLESLSEGYSYLLEFKGP